MVIRKPSLEALEKLTRDDLRTLEGMKGGTVYRISYKDADGKVQKIALPAWVRKKGADRLAKAYACAGYDGAKATKS